MRKQTKVIIGLLFATYCAVMIYLLFFRGRQPWAYADYWQWVRGSLNLVPFATISQYISFIRRDGYLVQTSIINLAGNVVMFIPLGIFPPILWPKLRSFWRFIVCVAVTIILVEIIQLFTLVGSGDVDDLILNLVGASIGFCLYRVFSALHQKRKGIEK